MERKVLLSIESISKAFGGTKALDNISLSVYGGEIHCIAGANGSGKSTLIKILTGAYKPDAGKIKIGGQEYACLSPVQAAEEGIHAVYQENILAENLKVYENVFAGHEFTKRFGFISAKLAKENVNKIAEKYDIAINPDKYVCDLSVAEKQYVKILRAVAFNPKVLILDEPTAMLNISDSHRVLELMKRIAERGTGVIFISHHLSEVRDVADVVTVFRDGRLVSSQSKAGAVDVNKITMDMVGNSVQFVRNDGSHIREEKVFEVSGLQVDGFHARNSFSVRKGEVLGITGMVGAGRSEILEAIFGVRKKRYEKLLINGEPAKINCPADAIAHHIGFITEDRQGNGLATELSIGTNMICNGLDYSDSLFINQKAEDALTENLAAKIHVKCESMNQIIQELSGGNQQKVIISRWLIKGFHLLLLDEPTKGVDVGAKAEIYQIINDMTKEGKSILLVSSDMQEVITICNRVLVLKEGEVVSELSGSDITESNIIKSALGVNGNE